MDRLCRPNDWEFTVTLAGRSLIGFREGSTAHGAFRAHNPVTGQGLEPQFYSASAEDVEHAAKLAHEAFESYSRLPGHEKGKFLRTIAANLESIADELI